MNKIIVGLVVGLVLGIIVSPALFPRGNNGYWGMMGSSRSISGLVGGIDRHFIEQMIPHHDGAIEMAKLALEKSNKSEILSLANDIIIAQAGETTQMQEWYKNWYGINVPVTSQGLGMMMGGGSLVHMGGMASGDLEALRTAGDFDREFIEQMIPHHEMAIMMARMLEAGTEREEMKNLAENIISAQSEEIEEMRGWYETWY
jgi:uncharacterized protein (DUF305 family)